jgi:hypothetical protein
MARADRPRPEPIVRTVERSTLLDSGMDVYFRREVTGSEEAAETGASPWDIVELRSETARLENEEISGRFPRSKTQANERGSGLLTVKASAVERNRVNGGS